MDNSSLETPLERVNYFNQNKNFYDCKFCLISEKLSEGERGSCQKKDEHIDDTKLNEKQNDRNGASG